MEQKQFAPKSRSCEEKKAHFCFIVAKNGSMQKNCLDMELAGDVGAKKNVLM